MRRAAQEASLLVSVIVLALIVWFVIADTENREIESRLGFSLPVEVRELGSDLVVVSEPLPVTVTVFGREADVEAARPEHFLATVSMRNRVAGQHSLPVRVDRLEGEVRVRAVQPETVVVVLQQSVEREVPVVVEPSNLPPLGFRVGTPEVRPETALVSGIAAEVEAVESVVARLDLGGARASVERDVTLEARTAAGGSVSQVLINPRFAQVRVPIEQEVFRKTASILPDVIGTPAAGYRMRTVSATPTTVEVLVSLDVLDDEVEVSTEPIDIGGRTANLTAQARLVFADGVVPAGETEASIQVTIAIEPVLTTVELPIALRLVGLRDGLEAAPINPPTARVTLHGPVTSLSELEGPLGPIEIDISDLGAGRHLIALEWQPPSEIEMLNITPDRILITVSPIQPANAETDTAGDGEAGETDDE
ncbi:MAG: CdaR family protein [Chloroflexi bacterium]|nr:CdaR family protein [Chloroflexota bacterium]